MLSASSFLDYLIIWRGEREDDFTIFHNFVKEKQMYE